MTMNLWLIVVMNVWQDQEEKNDNELCAHYNCVQQHQHKIRMTTTNAQFIIIVFNNMNTRPRGGKQ